MAASAMVLRSQGQGARRRTARTRVSGRTSTFRTGFLLALLLLPLVPALAHAGQVSLAWDPNAEPNIQRYLVTWRNESGGHAGQTDAGAATTATVPNLTDGVRYYFRVIAVNTFGQMSPPSAEVSTIVGGGTNPPVPPTPPTPPTPPAPSINTYFAEGVTGVFDLRIAIVNTTANAATVTLTFLPQGAAVATRQLTVAARSRATFSANTVTELAGTPFGIVVAAPAGVYSERTVSWNIAGKMGATVAKSIAEPAARWYLAEGNAGYFDTFVLLANPNGSNVSATVDFLLDDGSTVRRTYTVPANQRLTIYTNEIAALRARSFGTTVNASGPILAERAMYFRGTSAFWQDGHASSAVSTGAQRWFLAEGQTGSFFDTFVLLSNPNPSAVTATIRYLTPSGVARTENRTLPPTSRTTIMLGTVPGLGASDVSCDITATANIIVERSMYWPHAPGPWYGGHNSVGLTALGSEWALAEGEIGGSANAQTFILLANPGTVGADVTATFYRGDGRAPLTVTRRVEAGARVTIDTGSVGMANGERFGTLIVSTQPIAVERSNYWSTNALWSAGSNETGFRVR